ncbi:hypothetical protein [Winogradskyella pulchriflava]|uniref:Outer membrane protein beta-barrel domain-containing protein n=1 Tax=Winogradskyella pulchriflava TaxID=1110688 RepID=A0ABV6Q891_9FLAO
MNRIFIILIALLATNEFQGQSIKQQSINAQIGFAVSSPYESSDEVAGTGFFLQGEYVMRVASWLELKPYAGLVLANANNEDLNGYPTDEFAESRAFLIGGKARVRAPIRWVAPYIEIGIGASIGKFATLTDFTTIEKNGLIYHIPVAFGLELGRNNNFDLGFTFYAQPSVEQSVGAFAIGISFPLKTKKSPSN